ncbi:uncharacterized protein LAESUDRAFT_703852 [Laetiporus sulphureus 93-53]|uniref:F-box domain-containing protein n=1 Tax=Laetiporus sulphureus 93-53 TaxID=1314785 RepID=A0A165D0F4_9APHY|nr:uncharacterized protein LAESUDRAFT_703852 [Laetiporus sulphureus 93-53]KZT03885.1 hypothetical protein LAESUDRAFT_703852 [Laetiporus sulphureus 93-53]
MHDCLRIREVLEVIIEHAYYQQDARGDETVGTQTVLALALTCRSFLETALDKLWETQENLVPLMKTLPRHAWIIYGKDIVTLVFPLQPVDWNRFDSYAKRIKVLGLHSRHTRLLLNLRLLDAFIAQHPEDSPLLPNLRRLHWASDNMNKQAFSYARLFIVPSLKCLQLDFASHFRMVDEQKTLSSFLYLVQQRCQAFTTFAIDVIPFDRLSSMSLISSWANHRKYVPRLSKHDIICILSMPYLREVQLWIGSIEDIPAMSEVPDTGPSPSLRVLKCHCRSLDIARALLDILPPRCLEALSVSLEQRPQPRLLREFFLDLQQICSPKLHALQLFDTQQPEVAVWERSRRHPQLSVGAETLAPLLAFSQLRILEINCSSLYQLDDAALIGLARSFPLLAHLELGVLHGWNGPSQVTFNALNMLNALCPDLHKLGLALDLTSAAAGITGTECVEPSQSARVPNARITRVHLTDSKILYAEAAAVGVQLVTLFPNLMRIATRPLPNPQTEPLRPFAEEEGERESLWQAVADKFWRKVEAEVAARQRRRVNIPSPLVNFCG